MKLFKLFNSDLSNKSYTAPYDYWSESLATVLSQYFQDMLDDWSQWVEFQPYDGLEFTLFMIDTDQAGADFLLYDSDDIAQEILTITYHIEDGTEPDDWRVYYTFNYQTRNTWISETELWTLLKHANFEAGGNGNSIVNSENVIYKSPSMVVNLI